MAVPYDNSPKLLEYLQEEAKKQPSFLAPATLKPAAVRAVPQPAGADQSELNALKKAREEAKLREERVAKEKLAKEQEVMKMEQAEADKKVGLFDRLSVF